MMDAFLGWSVRVWVGACVRVCVGWGWDERLLTPRGPPGALASAVQDDAGLLSQYDNTTPLSFSPTLRMMGSGRPSGDGAQVRQAPQPPLPGREDGQ